jgi:hypothetical protein
MKPRNAHNVQKYITLKTNYLLVSLPYLIAQCMVMDYLKLIFVCCHCHPCCELKGTCTPFILLIHPLCTDFYGGSCLSKSFITDIITRSLISWTSWPQRDTELSGQTKGCNGQSLNFLL